MGQRHNRKRTRSRPRHRGLNDNHTKWAALPPNHIRQDSALSSVSVLSTGPAFSYSASPASPYHLSVSPLYGSPTPVSARSAAQLPSHSATHWHLQYSAWQDRLRQQKAADEEALEAERLRLFGGEAGDEVSLCEPMLRVVMHLFNGIDYVDP